MVAKASGGFVDLSAKAHCTDPRKALDNGAFAVAIRKYGRAGFDQSTPICTKSKYTGVVEWSLTSRRITYLAKWYRHGLGLPSPTR